MFDQCWIDENAFSILASIVNTIPPVKSAMWFLSHAADCELCKQSGGSRPSGHVIRIDQWAARGPVRPEFAAVALSGPVVVRRGAHWSCLLPLRVIRHDVNIYMYGLLSRRLDDRYAPFLTLLPHAPFSPLPLPKHPTTDCTSDPSFLRSAQ